MITERDLYASRIFIRSVLPLIRVIAEERPEIGSKFAGKNGVVQIGALDPDADGKTGMHYLIEDGKFTVNLSICENPDIELLFKDIPSLNGFFSGKSKKLPKIKGLTRLGLLIPTMKALLFLSSMLSAAQAPREEDKKEFLVKLYFYLLSSGISQLNKAGHPDVTGWAKRSPDRVYAWRVMDKPELSAYIRVKAGNTKAARGQYKRSKPFFTMCFDSVDSALGTLLQTDDLVDATAAGRLIMEGAPEFGAEIGDYMMLVGDYAK